MEGVRGPGHGEGDGCRGSGVRGADDDRLYPHVDSLKETTGDLMPIRFAAAGVHYGIIGGHRASP
jgi:hypothetical protein